MLIITETNSLFRNLKREMEFLTQFMEQHNKKLWGCVCMYDCLSVFICVYPYIHQSVYVLYVFLCIYISFNFDLGYIGLQNRLLWKSKLSVSFQEEDFLLASNEMQRRIDFETFTTMFQASWLTCATKWSNFGRSSFFGNSDTVPVTERSVFQSFP